MESILTMKKFDKIKRLGHPETDGILEGGGPLTIKEKVDGANCRFSAEDDKLMFGSRNCIFKNEKDAAKSFRHAVDFVRTHTNVADVGDVIDGGQVISSDHDRRNLVFFGEAMHKHTIEYSDTHGKEIGWKGVPSFIGFDVWCSDHDSFLTTEHSRQFYDKLGLPFVNVIGSIDPDDFMDEYGTDFVPESEYYDGPAEGVVLTNERYGLNAKLVSEEFAEKHGSVNSGADPNGMGEYDTHEVANTYCTEARIRKHIHKLEDEGHDLGRPMMQELPVRVTQDIIEEEALEFATSGWVVDFKELRSEIAQSTIMQADCLSTINSMMNERVEA